MEKKSQKVKTEKESKKKERDRKQQIFTGLGWFLQGRRESIENGSVTYLAQLVRLYKAALKGKAELFRVL